MRRSFPFFFLLAASLLFISSAASASDEPFTGPSNWGGTGLMTIPTARVMKENTYRIGAGQVHPYRYYYGAISPLRGLEITGRITQVINVPGFAFSTSYGDFKDKAIDLKYQVLPEGKYTPALAIGIIDPHGTRVYSSQLIVASKQIYPFDFTLGFGNGRFGKSPLLPQGEGVGLELIKDPKGWLRESQFFWGIQFMPSEKYAFMLEYSPILYERQITDPAQKKYFNEPVPSKFNFGFRWRPFRWTELDLSLQRGNRIGLGLSMNFEIGRPLIPIYDRPYKERPEHRADPLAKRIAEALRRTGFSDIGVSVKGDELFLEVQNDTYYYSPRAMGMALRTLEGLVPEDIKKFHLLITVNGIPMTQFSAARADLRDLFADKLALGEFLHLSGMKTDISKTGDVLKQHKRSFSYGIRPSVETLLNDPSGFFKYRVGASAWGGYHPWKGASFVAGLSGYPLNNVSSVNEPLSIPVRTDLVLYKKTNAALDRLMFDQILKTGHELYGRVSAGLLEVEYAGIDGEIAMPFLGGRFMAGVGGSVVKKRDPDNPLRLKSGDAKDLYGTLFLNTRFNFPEKEISVDVRAGRFLAGDRGARITISKFINGVIISAWYSFTDTSVFNDEFNRGYHDKGISVSFPLRLFKGSDSKTSYHYALSPWTRDVAQDIDHFNPLFDFIGRDQKVYLERDRKEMFR